MVSNQSEARSVGDLKETGPAKTLRQTCTASRAESVDGVAQTSETVASKPRFG